MEELSSDIIIIGGDFNFVTDYRTDSNYCQQNNPRARDVFVKVTNHHNLIDVWKEMNPHNEGYTWSRQNPFKYGRLDRIYTQEHLLNHKTASSILAGYRSDHNIVSLHIKDPQRKRGPGVWKFNDSLLDDDAYKELVNKVIEDVVKQYAIPLYSDTFLSNPNNFEFVQFTIDVGLFYETLLMMIRGETVRFSKLKARALRTEENGLMREINNLHEICNKNKNQNDFIRLETARNRLEELRKPKIQGQIIRSRARWYEEGERSSKYFLSLEKRN